MVVNVRGTNMSYGLVPTSSSRYSLKLGPFFKINCSSSQICLRSHLFPACLLLRPLLPSLSPVGATCCCTTHHGDHLISPVLSSLQWLPAGCRTGFQTLFLTFKAFNRPTPNIQLAIWFVPCRVVQLGNKLREHYSYWPEFEPLQNVS